MPDKMIITSASFAAGAAIPREHTCDGPNVSPPLEWASVPAGTKSLTLIVDDPDAPSGTFTHWILFNLPGDTTRLPRDLAVATHVADADPVPAEGTNDFSDVGYGGPCPPPGDGPHRYIFRLYALDTVLGLDSGATKPQVLDAMDGHVIGKADHMGTYER